MYCKVDCCRQRKTENDIMALCRANLSTFFIIFYLLLFSAEHIIHNWATCTFVLGFLNYTFTFMLELQVVLWHGSICENRKQNCKKLPHQSRYRYVRFSNTCGGIDQSGSIGVHYPSWLLKPQFSSHQQDSRFIRLGQWPIRIIAKEHILHKQTHLEIKEALY